jgi:D-alanyl-D-alanine carboxypeptidase (penicillin-binding protein 5/6)
LFTWLFLGTCCDAPARGAESGLPDLLRPLIAAHKGQVAVAVKHLDKGEEFTHNADTVMPTASLIKLAVMATAYRLVDAGKLDLDRTLTLRAEDKVPVSGVLTAHFSAGAKFTVRDALQLMIAFSDNTATNLVLEQIGGLRTTAETMEQLGYPNTKIHAQVYRRDTSVFPERSRQYGLGSTTPREMIRLLEQLHRRQLATPASCEAMLRHLTACEDKDLLARELPPAAKLAHKTGAVDAVRTDAGILSTPAGPIAICVMTAGNQDRTWTRDNAAQRLCGQLARITYQHFNPPGIAARPEEQVRLVLGAAGSLVEALQRTLNARLSPSPELSVDGDFGSLTRDAVRRFQREHRLPVSGEVGPETWTALGTLLTQDAPVPDPATVNAENLPREPADDPNAPPLVTCKAWAVGDARTGKLLWGHQERRRLDIASTTKIMTAYVVLRAAEKDPRVLEETVVFSQRADDTPGSSARLHAGEQLPVRELLYGLLLPSGNDAATALAEHFGGRLAPPERAGEASDPLVRFVAEMNRTAKALGMHATGFANPHGITDKVHLSTAADLLLLAHAARQLPRFRDYVNTRQHGCTVTSAAGYRRNALWKNTNHLLAIEGYDGVKTGTTDAAGACLVACGSREGRELLVVVLGSSNSDARYVDSRNLFRWAWQQPAR